MPKSKETADDPRNPRHVHLTIERPENVPFDEVRQAINGRLQQEAERLGDIMDPSVTEALGVINLDLVLDSPASQATSDEIVRQFVRDTFREQGWGRAEIIN